MHEALNVVDVAFKSGISLPLEAFHSILQACDRSCEFNMVCNFSRQFIVKVLNRNNAS